MNSSGISSPIKILTDIQIRQNPEWCEKTAYLGNLSQRDTFISRIPVKVLRDRLSHFLDLITIIKFRREYDVVINASIKTGQLFALFRHISRSKTPKHIILELMLDEERRSLRWKIKKMMQKIMFSSVDVIFVSSRGEIATYSKRFTIPEKRFRFLPFHTNVVEPRMINHPGNYILSAGKTGRDYVTLAEAVSGLKEKVIVVSDRSSVKDVRFPANVDVLTDISYSAYLDLLYHCSLVIVPLKKLVKSIGQVAILEAMALGKPVIATETTGTTDYIQTGINGILVPLGEPKALKDGIQLLVDDPDLCGKLSSNGLESVKENHTFDKYVRTILTVAHEIVERSSQNEF